LRLNRNGRFSRRYRALSRTAGKCRRGGQGGQICPPDRIISARMRRAILPARSWRVGTAPHL